MSDAGGNSYKDLSERPWADVVVLLRSAAAASFLSKLLFELTLAARGEYGPEGTMPEGSAERLRSFNEMAHRTAMQLKQTLGEGGAGYPNGVYIEILASEARRSGLTEALIWAVTRALQSVLS